MFFPIWVAFGINTMHACMYGRKFTYFVNDFIKKKITILFQKYNTNFNMTCHP